MTDDFFDDEEDRGDGGVERGGEARGGAHRSEEAHLFAGEFETGTDGGGQARADLQ